MQPVKFNAKCPEFRCAFTDGLPVQMYVMTVFHICHLECWVSLLVFAGIIVAARLSVKIRVIKRDGQKIKVSGTTYCLDAGFSEISVDVFAQLDASRLFDSTKWN